MARKKITIDLAKDQALGKSLVRGTCLKEQQLKPKKMDEFQQTLKRDAPGWSDVSDTKGPVCWKCNGTGIKVVRKTKLPVSCPVCFGEKRLQKKALKRAKVVSQAKKDRPSADVGPPFADVPIEFNPEIEEKCNLLGRWKILQSLKGGHRWSTDDLVTAWVACNSISRPDLKHHLDLGCGIGTVLLMVSWYFHDVDYKGRGIEAQHASFLKAERSIHMNQLQHKLHVSRSDFRDVPTEEIKYDLITGTPPYFPVVMNQDTTTTHPTYGALPTFEQSAPARFEFRGGVEVYVETAKRFLAPNGRLVLCEGNLNAKDSLKRIQTSAQENDMTLLRTVFVLGREDKPPLFAVHVLENTSTTTTMPEFVRETLVVRHVGGQRGADYLAMCKEMGIVFVD